MTIRRAPGVTTEIVDERAMLIDPAGTELIQLNPVGSVVWAALEEPATVEELTARLLDKFTGVTREELEQDLRVFIAELSELGLAAASDAD